MSSLDLAELSWAAGFFDGEGSTFARRNSRRPDYLELCVAVAQSSYREVPDVLLRFRRAAFSFGRIDRPNKYGIYQWRSRGFTDAQATIALLWRFLGEVKRRQALDAMRIVRAQYETRRCARRPRARYGVHVSKVDPSGQRRTLDKQELERAWAAGFLDAEGCFGLVRRSIRRQGAAWYAVRASATQHGDIGKPPAVLIRLQRALGGIGRIERHGEPDDFKWLVEGPTSVERVLELTAPWLSSVKLSQARRTLDAFAAQVRLKGNSQRCVRGHSYDRVRIIAGRPRRQCNACDRIRRRRQRAAEGIQPRQFRDPTRRYVA